MVSKFKKSMCLILSVSVCMYMSGNTLLVAFLFLVYLFLDGSFHGWCLIASACSLIT